MKTRGNHSALPGIAALTLLGAFAAPPAAAQETPAAAPAAPQRAPLVPARRLAAQPAGKVAVQLSGTGVLVLADKTVETVPISVDLPAGSLEDTLARIAAAMPAGTVVKKVYLAAPARGATMPEGSQVAALAAVQEALSGPAGAPPLAPGEVNLLGRRVSAEKAAPVIAALDLKPVYVLTNPRSAADPVQKMSAAQFEALQQWIKLTPEQQKAFAEQQFSTIRNMDPALRQQFFGQQRRVFESFAQRVRELPQAERDQLLRDIMGPNVNDGARPNPPAQGGDGGQP